MASTWREKMCLERIRLELKNTFLVLGNEYLSSFEKLVTIYVKHLIP